MPRGTMTPACLASVYAASLGDSRTQKSFPGLVDTPRCEQSQIHEPELWQDRTRAFHGKLGYGKGEAESVRLNQDMQCTLSFSALQLT
mmetsp:Transcript_10345/g.18841  ORF Transcript_10345/g.18841 Transcript_10345/m.18841 type:complete len:88 (+) Transcript_10345:2246-2509(+)